MTVFLDIVLAYLYVLICKRNYISFDTKKNCITQVPII